MPEVFIDKENILPEEAFYFIGQDIGDKINIIVEDVLSKKILDRTLSKLGEEVRNRFEIKFIAGGSSVLQQYISVYSNTNIEKSFFVFDGDQKKVEEFFDVTSLSESNKSVEHLKVIIKNKTGVDITFHPDGGVGGSNQEQLVDMMIKYLKYYKNHVFYLPQSIPENIIWTEELLQRLGLVNVQENDLLRDLRNNKDRIYEASNILFGSEDRGAMETLLITEWVEMVNGDYLAVQTIIREIESRVL